MAKPSASPLKELRIAVATYMQSEGCSCCSDYEQHQKDKAVLGKLLRVPKYKDGSGYDFKQSLPKKAS